MPDRVADHDHDHDHTGASADHDHTDAFDRVTFTDDELSELALAADPFDPFDDDVVPFEDDPADLAVSLLPAWYMPPPSLRGGRRRSIVFAALATALFVINVGGLCVTYGIPDPVWK